MKRIDLEYLCRVIGNLAGIPVRIYKDKEQTFFYSVVNMGIDFGAVLNAVLVDGKPTVW